MIGPNIDRANFARAAAYATNYSRARKVCILLCRSYILMDCSYFILAQPITHSLLRCCDRANFVRAAAYATNYARARKVCILLCRSYILMDCSDFIVAQLITH